jgi:hypothetical protein
MRLPLLLPLVYLVGHNAAVAQTHFTAIWTGGAGTHWRDKDNWSTDHYPTADSPMEGDNYDVQLTAGAFVDMQAVEAQVNRLEVPENGRLETLGGVLVIANPSGFGELRNVGELVVNSVNDGGHGTLLLGLRGAGASITNNGLIVVKGPDNFGIRVSGTVQLAGNGTMRLSGPERYQITRGQLGDENEIVQGLNHRLEGAGLISDVSLTNYGQIVANDASHKLEIITPVTGRIMNHGVMQARDGATLLLRGQIENAASGIMRAEGNSEIELRDARLSDAQVVLEGDSKLTIIDGVVLRNTTVFGDIHLAQPGGVLSLAGRVRLEAGQFTLEPARPLSSLTSVRLVEDTILEGTGILTIRQGSVVHNDLSSATPWLTVGPQYTVRGGGLLGEGRIKLTNYGTIRADLPGEPLRVDVLDGVNNGLIEATNGATLSIHDPINQTRNGPLFSGSGNWRARAGTIELLRSVRIETSQTFNVEQGGHVLMDDAVIVAPSLQITADSLGTISTLVGSGEIVGNLLNQGSVRPQLARQPDHSPLTVHGRFAQSDQGTFEAVLTPAQLLRGDDNTGIPLLNVQGDVSLAGRLRIDQINGARPQVGDRFALVRYSGQLNGRFQQLEGMEFGDENGFGILTPDYKTDGIDLVFISTPVVGDYNQNGVADAVDYVLWRKGLGTLFVQSDYNLWRANFGRLAGVGASTGFSTASMFVPEPSNLALVCCAVLSVIEGGRRNRQPVHLVCLTSPVAVAKNNIWTTVYIHEIIFPGCMVFGNLFVQ